MVSDVFDPLTPEFLKRKQRATACHLDLFVCVLSTSAARRDARIPAAKYLSSSTSGGAMSGVPTKNSLINVVIRLDVLVSCQRFTTVLLPT